MEYITYLLYLSVSIGVMVHLGNVFYDSGRYFLPPLLGGEMAIMVNRLLLRAYYLLNIGYAFFSLTFGGGVDNIREMLEVLSEQLGGLFLIIGLLNLVNMLVVYIASRSQFRSYDITYSDT